MTAFQVFWLIVAFLCGIGLARFLFATFILFLAFFVESDSHKRSDYGGAFIGTLVVSLILGLLEYWFLSNAGVF